MVMTVAACWAVPIRMIMGVTARMGAAVSGMGVAIGGMRVVVNGMRVTVSGIGVTQGIMFMAVGTHMASSLD